MMECAARLANPVECCDDLPVRLAALTTVAVLAATGCSGDPPAATVVASGVATPCGLVPPRPPATGKFAFLHTDSRGRPARWRPTVPIHYAIDPRGAPGDAAAQMGTVVADASAASGLVFVLDHFHGTETGSDSTAMVIRWVVSAEAGGGHQLGVTNIATAPTPGGMLEITHADITFNAAVLDQGLRYQEALITSRYHELGHALGLDHVSDPNQVMNPNAPSTHQRSYGLGDVEGLWHLGPAAGCLL